MKIAITATGNQEDSLLDSRFGRCTYFAVYDTEKKTTEFFKNPNKESASGAGPASVQFIASKGAEKVVCGDFGGKAKSLLEQLKIRMVVLKDPKKTIGEIIQLLNK